MHSYNSQTNNYGQSPKKAYYSNPNVDIYGKPVINTNLLNSEKAMILKEVEQNFNVKTLTNQMINNIKGDILNINLSITNDLILPIEMFFPNINCFKMLFKSM